MPDASLPPTAPPTADPARGAWPTFILGGTAKAGTTTLWYQLDMHPDVFMSPVKEPYHFAVAPDHEGFHGPGDDRLRAVVKASEASYRALFRHAGQVPHRGEASTWYLYSEEAPARVAAAIPDVQMVFVLRDPVDRAFSAWAHLRRDGREPLDRFEDALDAEASRVAEGWAPIWHYARMGRYGEQLVRWFDALGPEQVTVLLHDDLLREPEAVLHRVHDLIGVQRRPFHAPGVRLNTSGTPRSQVLHRVLERPSPLRTRLRGMLPTRFHEALVRMRNANLGDKPVMPDSARRRLSEYYADDLALLSELLGDDLAEWRG